MMNFNLTRDIVNIINNYELNLKSLKRIRNKNIIPTGFNLQSVINVLIKSLKYGYNGYIVYIPLSPDIFIDVTNKYLRMYNLTFIKCNYYNINKNTIRIYIEDIKENYVSSIFYFKLTTNFHSYRL